VNEAIASGVFTKQNPFLQIKLQYTDNTKAKLTMNELHRFQSCSFPDIRSLHLAQDFFMACFYANGCRAGDMATMTVSNIQNGYLCYTQGKTGKKMIVGLSDELNAIFLKYRCDTRACIFPLFEDNDTINERTINSKITYLNKYIREVAKYAGIVKKLSTHCARHTFMDHALSASGGNIYEIKEMAGHSSVKTTEVYLRQRVNGIGDGIRNKVLETLKGVGINE
jgi:integrase